MRGRPPKLHLSKSKRIWVDADACPKPIREILFRAAERRRTMVTLVANRQMSWPNSAYIRSIVVSPGFDMADQKILQMVSEGDLVVTSDIPLASAVIDKKALALNPRGELYTKDNVRAHLSERNFMTDLRSAGVATGGPEAFSARDQQEFANQLDNLLTQTEKLPAAVPAAVEEEDKAESSEI